MKTSVIHVHDMLSVLSVAGVEKRIGEVPGVESVTVNFAAGSATVRYDETRLEVADIKSAVRQLGYESESESAGKPPIESNAKHDHAEAQAPQAVAAPTADAKAAVEPDADAHPDDSKKGGAAPEAKPSTPITAAPNAPADTPVPPTSATDTPVAAVAPVPPATESTIEPPTAEAPPAAAASSEPKPPASSTAPEIAAPTVPTPSPTANSAPTPPAPASDASSAPAAASGHQGHVGHEGHTASGAPSAMSSDMAHEMGHSGTDMQAMVSDMRNRFWICLFFTVPLFFYSPMGLFTPPEPLLVSS